MNAAAWMAKDVPPEELVVRLGDAQSVELENRRLIEDRVRFPDRPDDIGQMISAHIENLKAAAKAHEEAWRRADLNAQCYQKERDQWRACAKELAETFRLYRETAEEERVIAAFDALNT